jgi:hypothetical protein
VEPASETVKRAMRDVAVTVPLRPFQNAQGRECLFAALFGRASMPLQVAWVTAWFCCLYFAPMTQMRFIYFRF